MIVCDEHANRAGWLCGLVHSPAVDWLKTNTLCATECADIAVLATQTKLCNTTNEVFAKRSQRNASAGGHLAADTPK